MKKLLSLILASISVFSCTVFGQGVFSDLAENELEPAVEALYDAGIINGTGPSEFSPDVNVTRAEFCAMVVRAMGYDKNNYTSEFSDVSFNAYYYHDVSCLFGRGIINGYGSEFKPNNNITVCEAAKILVSVYENKYGELKYNSSTIIGGLQNYPQIPQWAKRYIIRGIMLGFVPRLEFTDYKALYGAKDNFEPNKAITRLQAAEIIFNLTNVCKNMDKVLDK
ncbi:MAG: S-layer homology domain-containing protein [Clostridia bacterium]|nr:S-layer homology domain-containing protein [Clostridia bacterium]